MCALVYTISTGSVDQARGWCAIFLMSAIVVSICWRHRGIRTTLTIAFLARLSVLIINEYAGPLPLFGGDALRFQRIASAWGEAGGPTIGRMFLTSGSKFYIGLLAKAYAIFGVSSLMMQSVNMLAGTLIVLEVHKLAALVWDNRNARRAAMWAALFPTMVLYSDTLLREAFFTLALIMGVRRIVLWTQNRRFHNLMLTFLYLLVATSFHAGAIPVVGVAAGVAILDAGEARTRSQRSAIILRWSVTVVVAIACLGALLASGWGTEKFADEDQGISIEGIASSQEAAARDRAGYLSNLTFKSPVDVIWQTPIRMTYFLFTPFPWQVRTAEDVIAFLDACLYMVLISIIFRRRATIWQSKAALTLVASAGAAVLVLAMFTSNYGTALRHRAKVAPLLIGAAAIGLSGARRERRTVRNMPVIQPGTWRPEPTHTLEA